MNIYLCPECGMQTANPNHDGGDRLIYQGSILTDDDQAEWDRQQALGCTVEDMPELTGKCYECGAPTDSYYCEPCNQKGLEEMDRTNDKLEAEYGHLRNQ